MTRKPTRNYSLSVVASCIAVLTLLIAAAVLAQTSGAGQASGKANAVLAPAGASTPAQAERPLTPWTDGAGRFPVGRSQTKRNGARPMDSNPPLFLPPVSYDSGPGGAMSVAVGDLNLDGIPDLVVANQSPGTVSVLLGNGDGTFRAAVTYDSGAGAGGISESVAIADLNGDGKPDLVVGSDTSSGNAVGVLLGNGDGTFQPAVTYPGLGFWFVAVADVNGDGKPDLIADSQFSNDVAVALGNGDGTFQSPVSYGAGATAPFGVAIADVNGDGHMDLLVANWWVGWPNTEGSVGVLLGNGDGTFQPAVIYDSGGTVAHSVAVADLNGDGKPDLVVANSGSGTVGVLLGNGDGTFQSATTYGSGGGSPSTVAVADVDGDGKLDLLVANDNTGADGTVGVLLGNGDGTFQPVVTYDSGGWGACNPQSLAVADLNGDGKVDLAIANCANSAVGVLLHAGSPTTTTLVSSLNPAAPHKVVTYTASVASQGGGTVTGTVAFQDGGSTIATIPLANQQAAYSTTYTKGGSHAITATYSGDAHNLASTSATLTEYVASVATKTVVTTSGSPSFVGQPVTFTATVTSSHGTIPDGELVTFYDGTTTLGSVALTGGTAANTNSSLSAKTHIIKATYAGDDTFEPSTGSVKQVVDKYPTTTALSSSLNPSNYGQAVTFTATVTPTGPYPLTGKVAFKDGTLGIGTVTLSGGVATITRPKLAVGTHSITATYEEDAFNGNSVSAAITQTVSQASVSMVLTSTPNPSTFGRSVHFTARLTSNGGVPTGQPVTFSYNNATLGTAIVGAKGVATFSTTTLPQGSDAVTAAYAGGVDYSSASATVTQGVN